MKKVILHIGALLFLLMTIPSYSQKSTEKQKKAKTRIEKTQKKKKLEPIEKNKIEVQKTQKAYNANNAKVKKPASKTQIIKKPTFEKVKAFDMKKLVKQGKRMNLHTFGEDFRSGDHSTKTTSPGNENAQGEFCTITTLNTKLNTKNFRDFTTNGPEDWMKPGLILNVYQFIEGVGEIEERYDRGPITIYNAGLAGENDAVVVNNPKYRDRVQRAVKNLTSENRNQQHGAIFNYKYTEIFTMDQLNYEINGHFSSTFGGISAKLGVTSNALNKNHFYLVEFTQVLFSLEVNGLDPVDIFPDNPEVDLRDYVYISSVTYGKRGFFMLKTTSSLEDLGVSSSATSSYLGNKAEVRANFDKISKTNNTEAEVFYYGGTNESASEDIKADWEESGRKPLEDYIDSYNFSESEAYPISYQLKNLNNQPVGLNSENEQTIETCVPGKLKLKVTLLELQCDLSGDSDHKGDFGINQHVRYSANGANWKVPISKTINTFPTHDDCGRAGTNDPWEGARTLICGGGDRQITVPETKYPKRRNPNINNSMVFEISPAEASDKNARFEIDTWVKEYSSGPLGRDDVVMNRDNRVTKVAIHDVLAILRGIKTLRDTQDSGGEKFFDHGVSETYFFDHFDGVSLPLRNVGSGDHRILEGPIRARNNDHDAHQKAFVWMRFELIE